MLLMDIGLRIIEFHRVGCDFVMPLLAVRPRPRVFHRISLKTNEGCFRGQSYLIHKSLGWGSASHVCESCFGVSSIGLAVLICRRQTVRVSSDSMLKHGSTFAIQ